MKKISLITLLLMMFSTATLACMFNTDCEPGSRCVKSSGNYEGVCIGGISPGNRNDSAPMRDRPVTDLNETYGDTCSFNTDCGPGSMCLKERGSVYGTCIKR